MKQIKSLLAALLLCAAAVSAAPVGSIKGYVRDASGAVVPSAKLVLRNQNTDVSMKAATDQTGFYQFLQILPSTYSVSVEAAGFRRVEVKNVAVLVDQIVALDVKLEVGQVSESVEVTESTSGIETERVSTGTAYESKLVTNLPTTNRRFNDIAILTPGVSFSAPGTQAGGFAAAGSRAQSTNWQIDGVNAMDPQVAGPTQSYRIADAVQEMSVTTTAQSAEFGRQSGAQVNVVTKSGTNQFHGSAFEFFRNDKLQAKDFFTNKLKGVKNTLRHNQYGGTVGGPVLKDKTFFFFSWEAFKENAPSPVTAVVPTQNQRNLVTDPIAKNLLAYFPLPTNTAAAEGTINYVGNAPNTVRDNTYLGRVDHNFSANDRLSGRYMFFGGNTLSGGALPTTGGSTNAPGSQNLSLTELHTFSPSMVTEVRLGYSRNKTKFEVQDVGFNPSSIFPGVPGVVNSGTSIDSGIPRVAFSSGGYASLGSATNLPQGRITNTYELYLNNTKVAPFGLTGHTVKFGYYGRREEVRRYLDGNSRGAIAFADWASFAGSCASCVGGASLLQNSSIRTGDTLAHYYRYPHAFYVQDDIKLRPNLTMNIGLRYELPSVATEKRNKGSNFIDGIGPVLLGTNQLLTLDPTKKGYASFGTTNAPITLNSAGSTAAKKDFAPVIGFAYTPDFAKKIFGEKKTVIRSGFRLSYDEVFNNIPVNQSLNAPFVLTTTQRAGTTQAAAGYPWALAFDQNISLVARTTQAPGLPANGLVTFNGYDPHAPTAYAENWNFGFQREITRSSSIDVSYIGSAGHKLGVFIDANQPKVSIADSGFRGAQAPNSQFFPFPQWGSLTGSYATFQGNSIYNGLVVSGKIKLNKGLLMQGSYTWSHGIDNSSAFFGSTGDAGYPASRANLQAERGNSANDQRHRFINAFVWDLPFGRGKSFLNNAPGYVNQVIGGWQISGITNLSTGTPFTVYANSGLDFSGFNQFVDRPDVQGSGPLVINRGNPDALFDPTFFGKVAGNPICPGYSAASGVKVNAGCAPSGRIGTSGRNQYYGPGLVDFDMTAAKKFQLVRERVALEYRADFFNIMNHTNFGLVGGNFTMSSSQFGLMGRTSAYNAGNTGGARVIQMTLKLTF